nr:PREDICTED: E3 ubiquitin-protein ligase TRIM11-like [Anolis carolinensis]|eukprot:XP_016846334.1 PREDICTED: E3 ubiquitin-protein ligase TRIM11-like [Anolis carolinensis]
MHQCLEEQETNFLAKIEEVEKEISAKGEEHLARLSKELSSLSKLIQEMEEKLQQPASELLQHRLPPNTPIRRLLLNHGTEVDAHYVKPSLFAEGLALLQPFQTSEVSYRDSLESGLHQQKAHVTLDPGTANPWLILSEDHRRVTLGEKKQNPPGNPERFDPHFCVLGQDGFRADRHFWEVHVKDGKAWSVGVARKSVQRKGQVPMALGSRKVGE